MNFKPAFPAEFLSLDKRGAALRTEFWGIYLR